MKFALLVNSNMQLEMNVVNLVQTIAKHPIMASPNVDVTRYTTEQPRIPRTYLPLVSLINSSTIFAKIPKGTLRNIKFN